jgi:hypothetical protein
VVYAASDATAEMRMDIAPAYPPEAGIASWVRTVRLSRGKDVAVSDRFALAKPSRDVALSLLTPCDTQEERPGLLRLERGRPSGGPLVVWCRFDSRALSAKVERIDLDDARLARIWGGHLNRIVLAAREPVKQGAWTFRVSR